MTTIADVHEWDEVIVTGRITSEQGRPRVVNLAGVVGTVSPPERNEDGQRYIKVWPLDNGDPQLPADHNGKLWFSEESLEAISIVRSEGNS